MRAVLSILLAVLVAANALFGCCRHVMLGAAHDDCELCHVAHGEACCQAGGPGEQHESPCSPDEGKQPCHGVCVYVPPEKVTIDNPQPIVAVDMVLPTHGGEAQLREFAWRESDTSRATEPSLRLHLINQILLI